MNFTLAELTKIELKPGEVLAVKLYGDDYEGSDLQGLQAQLQSLFPDNKIMLFILPNGNDLQFEKLSANLENSENKELTKLVDTLNDCSAPQSYCGDCGCGKKQRIERENANKVDELTKRDGGTVVPGADGTSDDSN